MCLSSKWTKNKTKKWLEKQPDEILAWKVVKEANHRGDIYIRPSIFLSITNRSTYRFKRRNVKKISANEIAVGGHYRRGYYHPNFHLFKTRAAARRWKYLSSERIFKCSVPKNQITTVGYQGNLFVIVTKEFTFLPTKKQEKYFED